MAVVKGTPELIAAELAAIDWTKVDAQTDEEIEAAVASDPDAVPIFSEARMIAGEVRVLRRRLGLTQVAFAARYGIPLGTLRDWEQGTATPDSTARTLLKVIAKHPDAVAEAGGGLNGQTMPAEDAARNAPGSYGCHEALHMASVLADMVERHVAEHPAVQANPEWKAMAERAVDALADLYQAIGAKHL